MKASVNILLIALLFVPSSAYAVNWFDTDWQFAQKITINSTLVNGTHSDWVIGVNLTSASLSANAASNGHDILFTDINNVTQLDHEIEFYDSASGYLAAWVNVPLVTDAMDTDIMMYYGDTGNNGFQNNTNAVWTDYHLVIHMGENLTDSSGNNPLIENFGSSLLTQGFGQSRLFDGINDNINVTGRYLDQILELNTTVTQWGIDIVLAIDPTSAGTDRMWQKGNAILQQGVNNQTMYIEFRTANDDHRWCRFSGELGFLACVSTTDGYPTDLSQSLLDIGFFSDDGNSDRNDISFLINGTCGWENPTTPTAQNPCKTTAQQTDWINNTSDKVIGAGGNGGSGGNLLTFSTE